MSNKIANSQNIIVGAGSVYIGPANCVNTEIVPVSASEALIDPTNVAKTDWGKWRYVGYTTEGVTMTIEPDFLDITVDQLLDAARIFKQAQTARIETSLAEATLENLYIALGLQEEDAWWDNAKITGDAYYYNNVGGATMSSTTGGEGSIIGGASTASANIGSGTFETASHQAVTGINLQGGALGESPMERSIAVVGIGPSALASSSSEKVERIYLAYRALSVESVSNAIRRDEGTFYATNFRLMPVSDGSYGQILDRVFTAGTGSKPWPQNFKADVVACSKP